MPKHNLKKQLLASSVAFITSSMAMAQDDSSAEKMEEELIVTGFRASLVRAQDIKREATGVVDAISAEDMGKFPDTNLAESLQRITGVAIDRSNNEGSKVSVRGFGPEFNTVTFNGRFMPTTQLDSSTRSFDFANIASEGVSGVEVYKTFSADKVSGGIGSVINIKTAKPLDNPGLQYSVGVKGVVDTTVENGDDVTPELSGLISQTFMDDTLGVGFFASHQVRDSQTQQAEVAFWRLNIDDTVNAALADDAVVVDQRSAEEQLTGNTYYPRNFGFGVEDISRTRQNAQLVLDYQPTDDLRATLDYTYSHFDNEGLRTGVGIWFAQPNQGVTAVEIDENGTYAFVEETCCDYASNQRFQESENENNSLGLNVNWQVNDTLNLEFDIHDSDAISQGKGRGNDVFLILAANNIETKYADFRSGNDIPTMGIVWDETATGVVNGVPTAATYDSLFAQAGLNINETDVTQFQFDGEWENTGEGITSLQFGVEYLDYSTRTRAYNSGQIAAGWYGGNEDLYPDDIFERRPTSELVDDFSGGGSHINPDFYDRWDFERGVAVFEQEFNGGARLAVDDSGTPNFDHTITEETITAYLKVNAEGDFNGLPVRVSGGIRWEDTDITANSLQRDPTVLVWIDDTEWRTEFADDSSFTDVGGNYDVWLPSIDFSIEPHEDMVARISYSKSITRPGLGDMTGTISVTDRPQPGSRTASGGNPNLRPYTSDNFDLSFEWYYDEGSYLSAGFFAKKVSDFVTTDTSEEFIGNLRDPQEGLRAAQAREDLANNGGIRTLHEQINVNAGADPDAEIIQNNDDPLAEFIVTKPLNLEQREVRGFELNVQHLFGETGFGVIANATIVDQDEDVDRAQVELQQIIPGISDTYNLVGFYENYGFQARIAYNYRDEFVNSINSTGGLGFTEAFGQIDMNVSYDIPMVDGLTVFLEGINVNGENQRTYNRWKNQLLTASQYGARYNIGARYKF